MRVGFIGTGSIGNPIAQNLQRAGHDLFVHDRRKAAARQLLEQGATWCRTPADVATKAEIILLSLPSHLEVHSVCFGAEGLFSAIAPGTYLIDLTTVSVTVIPPLVDAQRTYGIHYLTAPVSQGVDNAVAGRLSVFVGGGRGEFDYCRPVFEAFATTLIHTGDHFSAIAAKLVTNLLWYINAAAIGEALVIGAKAGIDLPVLHQAILRSCGTSWVAEHDIPSIFDGSFDPTFTTGLCCKDLALISELAALLVVPIEMGAMVEQIFRRARLRYGPESPELSVVRHLQEETQTPLQPPEAP